MKRFIVIVLDSFGIGYMKDVLQVRPQDVGANTCLHIFKKMTNLRLPNLERMGLGNALGHSLPNLRMMLHATYGQAELAHFGADTFYGHQEIVGTNPQKPVTMPFSQCIDVVAQALITAGYSVVYRGKTLQYLLVNGAVTVGDNIESDPGQIFNVTGLLDKIDFAEVLRIGKVVRQHVTVPRVIALGGKGVKIPALLAAVEEKENKYVGVNCPKSGVYNEGYLAIHLGFGVNSKVQVPTILGEQGIPVILLGKVADIVENPCGESISCVDTEEVMQLTLDSIRKQETAFILTNVQETDLAGHGENVEKYAEKLMIADGYIGKIIKELREDDILLVMADHGNDPTIGHSRHTREEVPLLLYGPRVGPSYIGKRSTLADVGATVAEYFQSNEPEYGQSFLKQLVTVNRK